MLLPVDGPANTFAFTATTSSQELKQGASPLSERKYVLIQPLDGTSNQQSVTYTIPYTACLMTATTIVDAVAGDQCDFEVLDTTTGTVSGIANYSLNKFGHGVYPAKGFYTEVSEYDAELFAGLQLKISVTPVDTVTRSIYFNITLHELT